MRLCLSARPPLRAQTMARATTRTMALTNPWRRARAALITIVRRHRSVICARVVARRQC